MGRAPAALTYALGSAARSVTTGKTRNVSVLMAPLTARRYLFLYLFSRAVFALFHSCSDWAHEPVRPTAALLSYPGSAVAVPAVPPLPRCGSAAWVKYRSVTRSSLCSVLGKRCFLGQLLQERLCSLAVAAA